MQGNNYLVQKPTEIEYLTNKFYNPKSNFYFKKVIERSFQLLLVEFEQYIEREEIDFSVNAMI